MHTWKTICKWTAIISLLFLGIPIRVKSPDAENIKKQFDIYIKQFNKTYLPDSNEYAKKCETFKNSLTRINELNSARTDDQTAKYGLTKFSDLTEDEFLSLHLDQVKRLSKGHQRRSKLQNYHKRDSISRQRDPSNLENTIHRVRRQIATEGLPLKVDWRDRGLISDVPDQGLCGACWAYSTVQVAETLAAKKTGNLSALSVQQMIDCATGGNFGCKGGDICSLLVWLAKYRVAIDLAADYPVTGRSSACHYKAPSTKGVRIKDFTCDFLVDNEEDILKWVALSGPVAVAVNALSWQNYLGGVIQHHCPGDLPSLNHAVQIIGYDLTAEIPYYIAKNSWGKTFGLDGYLHLAIGENICGIANEVAMIQVL